MAKAMVNSVIKAFKILKCFDLKRKALGVKDVMELTGFTSSTAHRFMATLEAEQILEREGSKYRIGIEAFKIGSIYLNQIDLRKVALSEMMRLGELTNETINLNMVFNDQRVCIEKVEGNEEVRQFISIGVPMPLYCGASGKLLLAFLPLEKRQNIIEAAGFSIHEKKRLEIDLEEIRESNISYTSEERVKGAASISAPIRNRLGEVEGGLTISGLCTRFTHDKVKYYAKLLLESTDNLSRKLGYEKKPLQV